MSLRFFGTWFEHLLGFIVIHSGGFKSRCDPVYATCTWKHAGEHAQWANSSLVRHCWKKKLQVVQPRTERSWKNCSAILLFFAIPLPCYPAWMVEREPIPVASPIFEGVVSKWEKIWTPRDFDRLPPCNFTLMPTWPRSASKSWLWRQGPILQRNGSIQYIMYVSSRRIVWVYAMGRKCH